MVPGAQFTEVQLNSKCAMKLLSVYVSCGAVGDDRVSEELSRDMGPSKDRWRSWIW
jgi:hypothetical protein